MQRRTRPWWHAVLAVGVGAVLCLAAAAGVYKYLKHRSMQVDTTTPVTLVAGEAATEITVPDAIAGLGDTSVDVGDTDPATFYVSSTLGTDANDGQTAETPWQTLQPALNGLAPGQTLFLMDGEYRDLNEPDNSHYQVHNDGEPDAYIRIAAAPGHHPVIVPTVTTGIEIRGAFVEVEGLTIRGEGFDIDNNYGSGIIIRNAHHIRLVRNTISDMATGGISAVESSHVEIYENEVFRNAFWGPDQSSGISIWHARDHGGGPFDDGYHDKIIGNTIYANENKVFSQWSEGEQIITDGNGVIIDETQEFGYTGRTLVANNVIFDNGGRAIIVNKADRVDIVFNTTYHNGRTPDLAGGAVEIAFRRATDVRVLNNLAWSRPGLPAMTGAEADQVVVGGNLLITDNTTGVETELDMVTTADAGLIAPSTDPALADFRPTLDSIVIDSAIDTEPRVSFDADGQPRPPIGAEVGAYVFAS